MYTWNIMMYRHMYVYVKLYVKVYNMKNTERLGNLTAICEIWANPLVSLEFASLVVYHFDHHLHVYWWLPVIVTHSLSEISGHGNAHCKNISWLWVNLDHPKMGMNIPTKASSTHSHLKWSSQFSMSKRENTVVKSMFLLVS